MRSSALPIRLQLRAACLAVLFVLLLASSTKVSPAAAFVTYKYGALAADTKYWYGGSGYVALRASQGWAESSSRKIYVAAWYDYPNTYGSWVDGFGYACHSYSGYTQLAPVIWNPHSVGQNPVQGRMRISPESAC
jgi:hypothetical protein